MHAKKHLGQHFLKSERVVRDAIDAAKISPTDTVLEIGPGTGVLTRGLLERAGQVVAVEKDPDMVEHLTNTFAQEIATKKIILVNEDALDFHISPSLVNSDYKLVANIPYYITGAIVEKFLTAPLQPSCMVLLVQKEVAQRIIAQNGKESILSISVKSYGTPRYIRSVKASFFTPPPKVDSALLLIDNISRDFFTSDGIAEKDFFTLVKKGFAHKRKMLKKNLGLKDEILTHCNILLTARAENLKISEWACIASLHQP